MDFYALSDKAIAGILGQRLQALRLRKNITQASLAKATTLSINTIKSLEKGQGKLTSLIAVLRELNGLSQFNYFIAEIPISPIQLAKVQGLLQSKKSHTKVEPIDKGSRTHSNIESGPRVTRRIKAINQPTRKRASHIKKQKGT